jgi:hypothetical protein
MKFTGHVFDWTGTKPFGQVTAAVVTKTNISLDWSENVEQGHLQAVSSDGVHYKGRFGYPNPVPNYEFDLTVYRAKGEILIFGKWHRHEDGFEGIWAFRLAAGKKTRK